MSNETKRKLVNVVYDIIQKEGIEGVTARKVANATGFTAPVIYKHFESLPYLITVASLRYLDGYNEKISILNQEKKGDALTKNKKGWRIFIDCAFENPAVFEWIFWGKGKLFYEDAFTDYYLLFPEKMREKNNAYLATTVFLGDMERRDYIWLRRAANEGSLRFEDASYISRVDSFIVRGMLLDYLREPNKLGKEAAAMQTYAMLEKNIDTFVLLKKQSV